jgi:hypothetical protein
MDLSKYMQDNQSHIPRTITQSPRRAEQGRESAQSGTGGGTHGGALRWRPAAREQFGGRSSGGGCGDDACDGARRSLGERWALATWLRERPRLICC